MTSGLTVQADFVGDNNYSAADSAIATYTTTGHATSVTLNVTPSTAQRGSAYTVLGTLRDQVTGTNLSSKTVTFAAISPIVIPSTTTSDTGTYLVSGLKAPTRTGNYQIAAAYGGDTLYLQSTSPTRIMPVIK